MSKTLTSRPFSGNQFVYAPSVWDPLSARLAESLGYQGLALGGYALGANTTVTEPLLTLTQLTGATRLITSAVEVPLVVDAATGYGDPMHIVHTVRELELAGASALHIEDQLFPKRAHYHQGIEHVVSVEEMCTRIEYADRARSSRMTLIARTDSMATDGFDEGIQRAKAYQEAGADMVLIFPNSRDEARQAPKLLDIPLVTVNSPGNRFGRPVFTPAEAEALGYRMVIDSAGPLLSAYRGAKRYLRDMSANTISVESDLELIALRKELEDLIGLEGYYQIETDTVER